jgi:endonuclease/exonuclease/phosphatase family metal-dependent hydrolase
MVLAVAGLVMTAMSALPAQAYGPQTRIFDWNSAGAQVARGPAWLENTIYQSILSRGTLYPGMVTLQEVCRDHAEEVQGEMASKGFGQFAFYQALGYAANCPVDSGGYRRFGNAVWVWGGGMTWQSPPFPNQQPGVSEQRGMACIGPTAYGSTHVCSTHFVNGNIPMADCQANDAFYWVEGRYAQGGRAVLAGDFNIAAGTSEVSPTTTGNRCPGGGTSPTVTAWTYSNYWEPDQFAGSAYQATHDSGRKIDYIWVKKGWGGYWQDLSVTSSASDHRLLEAYLAW